MELQNIETCPICRGTVKKLEVAAKYYVEPLDVVLEQRYGFCQNCQFVFCTTPLSEEQLDEYYVQSKRFFEPQQRVPDLQHAESQAVFALRYVSIQQDFKLLEIGPFRDYFLAAVLAKTGGKGYFSELNKIAVERLLQQGYSRVDWQKEEKFDLIGLRHVLEHIVDLNGFMDFLATRLNTDGVVFVEVPDLTHTELAHVDGLQFEHVNYFTQKSLLTLAEITGFHVVGMESVRMVGSATSSNQVLRVALRRLPTSGQQQALTTYLERSLSIVNVVKALLRQRTKIAFYGAGTLTQMLLPYLVDEERPLAIFDADTQKQGTNLLGIAVKSPDYLVVHEFDTVFITVLGPEDIVINSVIGRGFSRENIICLSSLLKNTTTD
jgi:hypothetical protein